MSPDLIAFLLDALPWLALAVTLGYLVGRFGYPQRGGRLPEDDEEGPDGALHSAARNAGQRDRDPTPLQRSAQEALASRSQCAYLTDAEAFTRHVERLRASYATAPRAPSPRGDPRSLQ